MARENRISYMRRECKVMLMVNDIEGLLTSWAEEFVSSDTVDTEDFFKQKIGEFFDTGNE